MCCSGQHPKAGERTRLTRDALGAVDRGKSLAANACGVIRRAIRLRRLGVLAGDAVAALHVGTPITDVPNTTGCCACILAIGAGHEAVALGRQLRLAASVA